MAAPDPTLPAEVLCALKEAARAAYTLERHPVSLRELLKRPVFARLTYRQIYAWWSDDQWAQERRLNVAAWRQAHQEQARSVDHKRREQQVQSLFHLFGEAGRLRGHQSVRPRSWESLAQVQLKAAEMFRQWERQDREDEQKAREADQNSQVLGADDGMGDLGEEEIWSAAHFLLKQRLAASQPEQASSAVSPETSPPPQQKAQKSSAG